MAFRIGLSRDFLKPDSSLGFGDIGLGLLDAEPGVEWEFIAENTVELRAEQIRDYDAIIVLGPLVTHDTLAGAERLAVVARFGVGYDSVDVPACTEAGVMGAYLVMFPAATVRTLVIVVFFVTVVHLPAILLIGLWFVIQVFQGIASVGMDAGTAFWAHVGGLVVGAALTFLFRRRDYHVATPTVYRGY